MTRDYFKAVAFGVICLLLVGETALLGSVVWHGAMDASPKTISPDGLTITCRSKP